MELKKSHFEMPRLHKLLPDEVGKIIEDLKLIKAGAVIYFAIDPYEISEFCFPIDPEKYQDLDIDSVADSQAAFHEVFYNKKQKPILLPEYEKELDGILSYFTRHLNVAYTEAEMLDGIIKAGGLDKLVGKERNAYENIAEEHFNVLLAVARGVYSIGVNRFREIFHQRLITGHIETDIPEDKRTLQKIFSQYNETDLVNDIYLEIRRDMKQDLGTVDEIKLKRTLFVDAGAIDRTIYLNEQFEQAYKEERLSRRYIVLYLSSAPRSEKIFSLPSLHERLPIVAGKKYNIWRNRRQIFAYVVHKSSNEVRRRQVVETIENLEEVQEVLIEVKNFEKNIAFQCDHCILNKHDPIDCSLKEFCLKVKGVYEEIRRARLQVKNLGLVNTLDDYERIVTEYKVNSPKGKKRFESYLDLFADVCRSGVKDVARERMQDKQQWILINSEATNLFKKGFSIGVNDQDKHGFRTGKDFITGIDQILPIKPNLRSGKYNEILKLILDYYRDPNPKQFASLEKAYEDYVSADPGPGRREPDQELINCYLYLAFGKVKDEKKAYDYTKDLISSITRNEADLSLEQECRYVFLWAARRQGKFEEADECASISISKWPSDPRFYHGRCLNTYSWMFNEKQSSDCPHNIWDAIEDARKAIELYKKDEVGNREVIAVNYNNIAYFLAFAVTKEKENPYRASELLKEARQALKILKDLVPKPEGWIPIHPEYFHTEAYLEYQEFVTGFTLAEDVVKLKEKLERAKEEIDIAIQLYEDGPEYKVLKDEIEKRLSEISSGRLITRPKIPEAT